MSYFKDFLNLVFPNCCCGCGSALLNQEDAICTLCRVKLPHTFFHNTRDNPLEQIFWGRADVAMATAFLRMSKGGMVSRVIHDLKYNNNQLVGEKLGRWFAEELKENDAAKLVDTILPVPLHPKKQKLRGYNQCHSIAIGISDVLGCEVSIGNLVRSKFNPTQTRKGRYERWENVESIFEVKDPSKLRNKKVLLVDDVITTGSTIEACAKTLNQIDGLQLMVGSLAFVVH